MLRVAGNYPGHMKYLATGWQCQACLEQVREDQDHLTSCSGYSDLQQGRDFESDKELVDFYIQGSHGQEGEEWLGLRG